MEVQWWTVALAAVAVLLTFVFVFRGKSTKRAKHAPGDTILFLGNSGAGKSLLFSHLFRGVRPETVSSIEEERLENTQLVSRLLAAAGGAPGGAGAGGGGPKPFHAVCLPGNRRLRSLYQKHLPTAAGIVFVIDATAPDIKGTAAFLHELLVNRVVDERCPRILLAVTKNDLARKQPGFAEFIVQSLESELDILKKSQNSEGTSGEDIIALGVQGQAFKFAEDSPSDVTCVLCNVAPDGSADVAEVEKFIEQCTQT